jgi:hypothetical protein
VTPVGLRFVKEWNGDLDPIDEAKGKQKAHVPPARLYRRDPAGGGGGTKLYTGHMGGAAVPAFSTMQLAA